MFDANEFLTPSEAARAAGLSESTIRFWIRQGKLPAIETPLGRLVLREALERLVEERQRKRQSE